MLMVSNSVKEWLGNLLPRNFTETYSSHCAVLMVGLKRCSYSHWTFYILDSLKFWCVILHIPHGPSTSFHWCHYFNYTFDGTFSLLDAFPHLIYILIHLSHQRVSIVARKFLAEFYPVIHKRKWQTLTDDANFKLSEMKIMMCLYCCVLKCSHRNVTVREK